MSKIHLIFFDKRLPERFLTVFQEYSKRLSRWVDLQIHLLSPSSDKDLKVAREKDLEKFNQHKKLSNLSELIVLDETGQQLSTEKLSVKLENLQSTQGEFAFVVGPSYGLSKSWARKAKMRLGLSQLTLTHDMAQLILIEQIYRAYSIINNHPYHCAH